MAVEEVQEQFIQNTHLQREQDERGAANVYILGAGAAVGIVVLVAAGFTKPFGSRTDIEQSTGVITGYEKINETIVAGTHVQTSTTTQVHKTVSTPWGKKNIPTLWYGKQTDSEVDMNAVQKNSQVKYEFNPSTGATTVTVPKKAIGFIAVVPPEKTKTQAIHNGLGFIPVDIGQQLAGAINENWGAGRDSKEDALTQLNNISNISAAEKCMPLAYKSFTKDRFVSVNKKIVGNIGEAITQAGGNFDKDKIEVVLPKTIDGGGKYSDMLVKITKGKGAVEVHPGHNGDCIESDAARLQRDKLLEGTQG